ncbi:hypothetical protein K490DRAFT_13585, partial [Saccharata proteae CBS 121410]
PDLTLPTHAPELTQHDNYAWDSASFALYSLITLPLSTLQTIATTLEAQWTLISPSQHMIRLPPSPIHANRPLSAVLAAHIALDKEVTPPVAGQNANGNLGWYPVAFIVVVGAEWEDGGLLFVSVDDELWEESESGKLVSFRFRAEDAYDLL